MKKFALLTLIFALAIVGATTGCSENNATQDMPVNFQK